MADEWTIDPPDAPPSPKPGVIEDSAKAAAAQGTLGFGDIGAIPGEAAKAVGTGVDWLARKGMQGANLLGADIPIDEVFADRDRLMVEGLSPEGRKAVEGGNAVPMLGGTAPTGKGVEEAVKGVVPYTEYEAETKPGRYIGTGARFGTGNLLLGPAAPAKILARGAEGAVAGLGSEAAGDLALASDAPEYETFARFAGALGAAGLAKGAGALAKPWAMPKTFADETAMKLLAEDIQSGRSTMTLDQINEAARNGAIPSIIDMAGPKTRQWLAQRYGVSPAMMDEVQHLNTDIAARTAEGNGRVRSFMERNYPDLTGMSQEDMVRAAAEAEQTRLYDLARTAPGSQTMWSPELEKLTHNGYVQTAMEGVKDDFLGNKIPSRWGVNIPTGGLPPNLQYWDVVKKRLDGVINGSKPNRLTGTGDQATYESALEAKRQLVDQLDRMVPGYKTARDSHGDVLGSMTAPEAGESFGRMTKTRDVKDMLKAFDAYGPEQQQLFRRGLIRSFYDQIGAPGARTSTLVKRMTSDSTAAGFRRVLGDQEYNRIVGNLTAENLMAQAKAIDGLQAPNMAMREVGKVAAYSMVGHMANYLMGGGITELNAPALIAGGLGLRSVAKDYVLNYAEKRIAPRVASLMRSTNPDDRMRLGALITANPDAASFVRKVSDGFSDYPMKYLQSKQTARQDRGTEWTIDPSPENYDAVPSGLQTGGRVARKAGGRIASNPISAEVKKVRTLLSHKTATMLSMPDDAVATALHIAKGNP